MRFLSGILALIMILSGCGGGSESPTITPVPIETPAPTPAPTPEPTPAPTPSPAEVLLTDMSLEEKVYQLFMVTQDQLTGAYPVTVSGEVTRSAIEAQPVGGIIYFAPNLVSRDQCIAMIDGIQSYSKLGLFIAVDEEGGLVSRLGNNPAMGVTQFPDMLTIGEGGDTAKAAELGSTIGHQLMELGFNLDFAPVADVWSNPENKVIGSRAFGKDPQTAAEMVAACVEGFNTSGVLCTLKHYPGHGDTHTDSHYGMAVIDKSLQELRQCELIPFAAGIEAGAPLVMVGHLSLPQVTGGDTPATLSYDIVTELLRKEQGFHGLVVTDSMSMEAITDRYSSIEAAVMAIKAGVDIILMPADLQQAADGLIAAVQSGELTEERIDQSVLRILECKIEKGIIKLSDH